MGVTPLELNQSWQVGKFTIAETSPASGIFNWSYNKENPWTNTDVIRHDLFTVKSIDGTASQTFDFEITNTNSGVAKQEFHTQSTDGIKVFGKSNFMDALVLHNYDSATAQTFDLTKVGALSSIERVDITGEQNNTIKLNLASLMQAETVGSVHRLYITGNAGDVVVLVDGGANWKVTNPTTETLDLVVYNVYHVGPSGNSHDLLISQAITNIS